ncbi:hypothetical protein HPB47_026687 [Ixodes persulcatus]|uniref:Uncharacterized protein n=1 Tax=Ixodes persulcatus TaxID=34615 RepID=A0AC60PYJ5_IXOPE|nr:hypothetical protein HPB47_026687 [Ixodes persulcatus]
MDAINDQAGSMDHGNDGQRLIQPPQLILQEISGKAPDAVRPSRRPRPADAKKVEDNATSVYSLESIAHEDDNGTFTVITYPAAPTITSTWTRKGGGGASGIEHGRLRRRALPDFQQPLRLEQEARALAVATTQPRAKMAWQVKIRNAPTPTPWGNEYRWQAQQTFHQQSRLGCMDRQVICLGFRLLYKRLYKPPCEERSQAWLTCFVPQPSTRTTQDHLQSPVS